MARRSVPLAKLSRPRLYDALPRNRLFRLLDEARRHPLIWVAAPPGAGKTTLVASYLESRKLPGIWYQVDSGDSDPATFFYYLGLAASSLPSANKRSVLPLLTPEYLSDVPGFARRYFRELLSRLPRPSAVVFDNFQELPEDSPLHPALGQALGEIPDGVQVTVISRVDAPAPYSRYSANQTLELVDFEQMKLTVEETQGMVRLHQEVDDATVEKLHAQSGGWVAGLTLLIEQLRRGVAAEEIGHPDSMQEVFNYFADQIFEKASLENQHILLHLALLPRMTEQTAERLTACPNAGKLLDYLYRRHLFTDRRRIALTPAQTSLPEQVRDKLVTEEEPKRGTYTYQFHALFRAFLQHRARQTYTAKKLAEIARHAAELLEEGCDPDSAVQLYVEARDSDAAARVIVEQAPKLLKQGRGQTLRDWVGLLPNELVAEHRWLTYWVGTSLINIDQAQARALLEQASNGFAAANERIGQILAAASAVETYFFGFSDLQSIERCVNALVPLLQEEVAFPSPEAKLHAYSSLCGAIIYGQPQNPMLRSVVGDVMRLLHTAIDPNERVKAGAVVLAYCTASSDMTPGREVIAELQGFVDQGSVSPARAAVWWTRVGYYRYLEGACGEALRAFERANAISEQEGLPATRCLASMWAVTICCALDDLDRAERIAAEMPRLLRPGRRVDVAHTRYASSVVAMQRRGNESQAIEQGREAVGIVDEIGLRWLQVAYRIPLAYILLERGRADEARRCIAAVASLTAHTCFSSHHSEVLLFEAYQALLEAQGERSRVTVREALCFAQKAGWTYTFRWLPRVLPELFAEALRADIEVEYVRGLIRKFALRPPFPDIEAWPWPIKIRTLGRFEVELEGNRTEFSAKAPRKMLALLKALICFGGREIADFQLIDALWPDTEGDAARDAFGVAMHRLRKALGNSDAIQLKDSRVSLNPRLVWVDALAFERLANETLGPANGEARARVERALALYQGCLLPGDSEEPWSAPMRERLRAKFVHLIRVSGEELEQNGECQQAIALYLRGLDADELTESFYQGLMRCHQRMGRRAEALSVYRRMRQTLSVTLGIKPSPQSEALHSSLLESA
jgi:ATP/maltotriose-dependent transcriptional regulator MalT/DNA-binding SARP family transcriptional activator